MTGVGVEVLGVIAVGIGVAALLFASFHAIRKFGLDLPRWWIPAGIGIAMVGYSVWNDYAWYDRAVGRLPSGSEVLLVGHEKMPWAPWTYIAPVAVRFAALDTTTIRDAADGIRQAQIMLIERRGQALVVPQDFDCADRQIRRADSQWSPVDPDDVAFLRVCQGASG